MTGEGVEDAAPSADSHLRHVGAGDLPAPARSAPAVLTWMSWPTARRSTCAPSSAGLGGKSGLQARPRAFGAAYGHFDDEPRAGAAECLQQLRMLRAVSGDVTEHGREQVRGADTTHYSATVDLRRTVESLPESQREAGAPGCGVQAHRGLGPGDLAPDFELPDQDGEPVRLSALRGRPVVLTSIRRPTPPAARRRRAACATTCRTTTRPARSCSAPHRIPCDRQALPRQAAPELPAAGRRGPLRRRDIRRLDGEVHVRQDLLGRPARHLHHRCRRQGRPRDPEGVAEDPRRAGPALLGAM